MIIAFSLFIGLCWFYLTYDAIINKNKISVIFISMYIAIHVGKSVYNNIGVLGL
jgi:hypothetical protein